MARLEAPELDDPRWIDFVAAERAATPFHHPGWARLLADCYGFRARALVLASGAGVVAGLPVVEIRGISRRRRWVSLPFTDAVAPLGGGDEVSALLTEVERLRAAEGVRSLEVRASVPGAQGKACGFRHLLPLDRDPDTVYARFSKTRVQQSIVRASREGVLVRTAREGDGGLDAFYRLHLLTRRRLGVPVQPRRFFDLVWKRMIEKGMGSLLLAEVDGRPAAGGLFLEWNGTVVYKFGASDPELRGVPANHALLWEAIRVASAGGAHTFDFGRTDLGNEGLRAFKAGWGAEELPLVYTTSDASAEDASPGRVQTALGIAIRHSPAWVCRVVGEALYKRAA